MQVNKSTSHNIKHVKFLVDMNALIIKDQTIYIRYKLANILKLLIKNKNNITLHEELLKETWDGNSITFKTGITHSICKLRKILADSIGEGIKIITLSKVGYRLVIDTQVVRFEVKTADNNENKSISDNVSKNDSLVYFNHDALSEPIGLIG